MVSIAGFIVNLIGIITFSGSHGNSHGSHGHSHNTNMQGTLSQLQHFDMKYIAPSISFPPPLL